MNDTIINFTIDPEYKKLMILQAKEEWFSLSMWARINLIKALKKSDSWKE